MLCLIIGSYDRDRDAALHRQGVGPQRALGRTDAEQLITHRLLGGMPAGEALAIVAAVAGALDYAHQRGLLHRDVKPGSILLTGPESGDQRMLLSDFGIASQLGDAGTLTATGATLGTVAYTAPEQLMSSDVDVRPDQYALAATAVQLLTGAPPLVGDNAIVVISQQLTATRLRARSRQPGRLDEVTATRWPKILPAGSAVAVNSLRHSAGRRVGRRVTHLPRRRSPRRRPCHG